MPLQTRLQMYIDENGVRQCFIAEKIGMPVETLNRFLRGKKPLPKCWIKPLDLFLADRGY